MKTGNSALHYLRDGSSCQTLNMFKTDGGVSDSFTNQETNQPTNQPHGAVSHLKI
jgi:hypothetical protein